MFEFEQWKLVKDGYEVSNYGRIKSVKRKPKIIKSVSHNNYLYCNQLKDYVHIIIAKAFIPNPYKLSCVNHKDENKENNCVWNLEWCTIAYNNSYGNRLNKISKSLQKPIIQLTKEGVFVAEYESGVEAESKTGINRKNISNCCLGRIGFKTAGGYVWKFKEVA